MKLIPFFTTKLEKICASSMLLVKLMSIYYKKIVKREVALGEISSRDQVLCIGGGPLPCTALEIACQTGAHVQVVDIDPQAVNIARRVIRSLNMSKQVKVSLASGQIVDASHYSVVHVALQAHPHEEILKNIWKKAPCGTRILMRSPRNFLKSLYDYMAAECPCGKCKQIEQRNLTMNSTLLFTKEGEEEVNEKVPAAFDHLVVDGAGSMVG
ncbi:nicotianamine synthase family protein [Alkaliphilus crotonatoxidans]